MKTKEDILADLPQLYGTENYHKFSVLFNRFVLTDGAKYIAESCGAYWLMDAIASHYGSYKNEDFAIAKLTKQTTADGWMLNIEDGNDGLLADQYFEFSDFPLDEITLYVLPQDGMRVILLPSEY